MKCEQGEDLKVVAVVSMNKEEALVLNRAIRFVYERDGKSFIGADGPFRDVLRYERAVYSAKAFGGREFSILMADGSTEKLKDHWWSSMLPGTVSAAYGNVEALKKCYVFTGGSCIAPDDLAVLRATYTGCVYPYWDYEKVIKYDAQRQELMHEKRSCRALTTVVEAQRKAIDLNRAALDAIMAKP